MIKRFLYLILLMCCVTLIDLHMLNHPCIPRMVNDLSDMLLDCFCHYFIEDICINVL
jgi:hypothetical protein